MSNPNKFADIIDRIRETSYPGGSKLDQAVECVQMLVFQCEFRPTGNIRDALRPFFEDPSEEVGDRLTKQHTLLLTEAEMKSYQESAEAIGWSLNRWIRMFLARDD